MTTPPPPPPSPSMQGLRRFTCFVLLIQHSMVEFVGLLSAFLSVSFCSSSLFLLSPPLSHTHRQAHALTHTAVGGFAETGGSGPLLSSHACTPSLSLAPSPWILSRLVHWLSMTARLLRLSFSHPSSSLSAASSQSPVMNI